MARSRREAGSRGGGRGERAGDRRRAVRADALTAREANRPERDHEKGQPHGLFLIAEIIKCVASHAW